MTTPYANADTIRLWLERSGSAIPLDIEIFLQVHTASSKAARRRSLSPIRHTLLPPIGAQYVHIPPPPPILPPQNPFLTPPSPTLNPTDSPPPTPSTQPTTPTTSTFSRTSLHWGHIAFYYLVEQMHRWERFIFRFDKQFASATALKSIIGRLSIPSFFAWVKEFRSSFLQVMLPTLGNSRYLVRNRHFTPSGLGCRAQKQLRRWFSQTSTRSLYNICRSSGLRRCSRRTFALLPSAPSPPLTCPWTGSFTLSPPTRTSN